MPQSKIEKTNSEEPGGLRKLESERWYPTLFGWEIGKRLAYFTTGHQLSSLTRPSLAVQIVQAVQMVQIVARIRNPGNSFQLIRQRQIYGKRDAKACSWYGF